MPPLPPAPASSAVPRSAAPVRSGAPAVRAGAAAFRALTAEHWRAASGFAGARPRDGAARRYWLGGLVSKLSLLLPARICRRLAQFGRLVRKPVLQHRQGLVQRRCHPPGHGDLGYDIPHEFGSFHWQQDSSCSASRKASYLDDRGQSEWVKIKAASSENGPSNLCAPLKSVLNS